MEIHNLYVPQSIIGLTTSRWILWLRHVADLMMSNIIHVKYSYFFITIKVLDIMHRLDFYLNHEVRETELWFHLEVETTRTHSTKLVPVYGRQHQQKIW
jgi:hypothetical protein